MLKKKCFFNVLLPRSSDRKNSDIFQSERSFSGVFNTFVMCGTHAPKIFHFHHHRETKMTEIILFRQNRETARCTIQD